MSPPPLVTLREAVCTRRSYCRYDRVMATPDLQYGRRAIFPWAHYSFMRIVDQLRDHNGCVNTLNWSPSGDYLYTGSDDRCICIYALEEWKLIYKLRTDHRHNIFGTMVSPWSGGKEIVSCGADGYVCVNDLVAGMTTRCFEGRPHEVAYQVTPLPGFASTFAVCRDENLLLYDTRDANGLVGELFRGLGSNSPIGRDGTGITSFAFNPGNSHELALAANATTSVAFLDLRAMDGAQNLMPRQTRTICEVDFSHRISGLRYNHDGSRLAVSPMSDKADYTVFLPDSNTLVKGTETTKGYGDTRQPVDNEEWAWPVQHKNFRTFLKQPVFFGDRSEYFAHGCDTGRAYVYEVSEEMFEAGCNGGDTVDNGFEVTGQLMSDRLIQSANWLACDSQVVNEVCPHPNFSSVPIIAVSGIDHSVKIVKYGGPHTAKWPHGNPTVGGTPKNIYQYPPKESITVNPMQLEVMRSSFVAKVDYLTQRKAACVDCIQRRRYFRAIREFLDPLQGLTGKGGVPLEDIPRDLHAVVIAGVSNCALAASKLGPEMRDYVVWFCDLVLRLQPSNAKAHFRKASALQASGDVEGALEAVKEARRLLGAGADAAVEHLFATCSAQAAAVKEKQKKAYASMFS